MAFAAGDTDDAGSIPDADEFGMRV